MNPLKQSPRTLFPFTCFISSYFLSNWPRCFTVDLLISLLFWRKPRTETESESIGSHSNARLNSSPFSAASHLPSYSIPINFMKISLSSLEGRFNVDYCFRKTSAYDWPYRENISLQIWALSLSWIDFELLLSSISKWTG